MASTDGEVIENQHQQQNPEATNPVMIHQQHQNPNLTQLNPRSPKTLELDPERPPIPDPDEQIGVDAIDDDVVMMGSNVKSESDWKRGDFEGEGFEREVFGGRIENCVGFEERRIGDENGGYRFDGKEVLGGSDMLLRRCNGFDGVGSSDGFACMEFGDGKLIQEVDDGEDDEEEEEEEDEDEDDEEGGGFSLSMQGEASNNNLFIGHEAMQVPYGSLFDHIVQTNSVHANPSQFVNGHDDDNVIVHCNNKRLVGSSENQILGSNKRIRMGGSDFDTRGRGSDFDMWQHWMGKAHAKYMEKEQEVAESSMNQQVLLNELHKRQAESQQLQVTIQQMQQKRQAEMYRHEHELHLMVNLIKGYREALNDTKRKFAEYRERVCAAHLDEDEQLYKDVSGGGGLVLSVTELEKWHLKEEEERMNRLLIEKTVKDFEDECMLKFEEHRSAVEWLNTRLLAVENQIVPCRELIAKQKASKSSDL